jgi:hypothetical protein
MCGNKHGLLCLQNDLDITQVIILFTILFTNNLRIRSKFPKLVYLITDSTATRVYLPAIESGVLLDICRQTVRQQIPADAYVIELTHAKNSSHNIHGKTSYTLLPDESKHLMLLTAGIIVHNKSNLKGR